MRPHSDSYDEQLEFVVRELVEGGSEAGAAAIHTHELAFPRRELEKRRPLPQATAATVYFRDSFRCRYCDARTILTPVMQLLGGLYPDLFPFHKNWRGGVTHPAVVARSAAVDHVRAGAFGGDWNGLANLAT